MIYWQLLLAGSIIFLAASIALFTTAWAVTGAIEKTRLSFGAYALLSMASALAISAHALMLYKIHKIYHGLDTFSLILLAVSAGLLILGIYKMNRIVKN
jgi:hypothetical protein